MKKKKYSIISAAAAITVIVTGLSLSFRNTEPEDTFDNPYLAYAELEKALSPVYFRYREVESLAMSPVIVEDNVLIGANAVVIEGCRIGHDAVVAAGAVVVGDVEPNTVVAGCPARVIKIKDEKTAGKTALVDALREL